MKINLEFKENIRVMSFLGIENKEVLLFSDKSPNFINDKTHPDIIKLLWEDYAKNLDMDCRGIINDFPILVRPDTGVVFGLACGTYPIALRLPGNVVHCGRQDLSNEDGIYTDLRVISPEWFYFYSFDKGLEKLFSTALEYAKIEN